MEAGAWPLYEQKITNEVSGTNVARIGDGIFRISTPVELPGPKPQGSSSLV